MSSHPEVSRAITKKNAPPAPGDLNDIARKRKDSRSSPPSKAYEEGWERIWGNKRRKAIT